MRFIVTLFCSVCFLSLVIARARPGAAVQLGNFNFTGGTVTKTVDTNAITPGEGDEMVGSITNSTGSPIDDVTVSVSRDGATHSAPTSDGETTVTDLQGSGSSSQNNSATSEGFTANIQLGQQGGASVIPNQGTSSLGIDVSSAGSGAMLKVSATPSVRNKPTGTQHHADLLLRFKASESAPGALHALTHPFHDRAAMLIKNDGTNDIVSLSGTCQLPSGISLSSVHLQNPSSSFSQVPGTSVQITGNSFAITGFTSLQSAMTYEIVTVFSAAPQSLYKISIEAEY
jgi:hypothetical protein